MTPDAILSWLENSPTRPTRVQTAERYRDMLLAHWNRFAQMPPTHALNNRIAKRWSWSGLQWIKQRAWKLAEQDVQARARPR